MPSADPIGLSVAAIYQQIDAINQRVNQLGKQARSDVQVIEVRRLLAEIQPLRQELRRREAVRAQALADYSVRELKLLMDALLEDRLRVLGSVIPGQPLQGEQFDRYWRIEHEINALTCAYQFRMQQR